MLIRNKQETGEETIRSCDVQQLMRDLFGGGRWGVLNGYASCKMNKQEKNSIIISAALLYKIPMLICLSFLSKLHVTCERSDTRQQCNMK